MVNVAHINFDTFQFVETLKKSGISEPQAKALLEVQKKSFEQALDSTLATKSDIQEVKAEIQGVKAELQGVIRTEIQGVKAEIQEGRTEIRDLKNEIELRFTKVEMDIKFLKWSNNLMVVGIATLIFKAFF